MPVIGYGDILPRRSVGKQGLYVLVHAESLQIPADLVKSRGVIAGLSGFQATCTGCHGPLVHGGVAVIYSSSHGHRDDKKSSPNNEQTFFSHDLPFYELDFSPTIPLAMDASMDMQRTACASGPKRAYASASTMSSRASSPASGTGGVERALVRDEE